MPGPYSFLHFCIHEYDHLSPAGAAGGESMANPLAAKPAGSVDFTREAGGDTRIRSNGLHYTGAPHAVQEQGVRAALVSDPGDAREVLVWVTCAHRRRWRQGW